MDNANTGAPSGAPLARLRGIRGWQSGVIQADGQRWVTISIDWLDDGEQTAITLDPVDAETLGRGLLHFARTAALRDQGDRN
jgi:hypothetical protein